MGRLQLDIECKHIPLALGYANQGQCILQDAAGCFQGAEQAVPLSSGHQVSSEYAALAASLS